MTEDQRLLVIGAYINSALYCAGVFVAAIVTGNPFAWRLAIGTAGLNFLAYFAQLWPQRCQPWILILMVGLTIVVGICAGVALL